MAINRNKIIALADKHIAKQNYAKALNELKKLANDNGNDVNLLNKMGDLYSKTNDKDNAKQCFMKVAASYQHSGFNLKAIAVYKKIIRLDERFHDARESLVKLYVKQGHEPEAKGELRRMADLYLSDNTPAKALTCFEKIVSIDPANLDARIKISDILVKQGRLDSAAEQYVHMGRDLIDKDMINEAKKIVAKGMRISGRNVDLRVLNARLQLLEGHDTDAVKTLGEIIRHDPRHEDAIRTLGKLYLDRDQLKDALALFLKLFRLNPADTVLLEEAGRKLIEHDLLDQAFEALSPVADQFLRQQKHDDATRLYRSILYKDEDHPRAQEKLIEIYKSSGQSDNAILGLEKLIRQYLVGDDPKEAIPYIEQVLELKPDNQEWKDKLVELGVAVAEAPAAEESFTEESFEEEAENTDIHVFDDDDEDALPKQDILSESGHQQAVVSVASDSTSGIDADMSIEKHLTESEFLIKYGMLEKAQDHLMAVKEKDILNVKANLMLKDLFLRQGQIDMAVACQICLINVCIDEGNFKQAKLIIEEIRQHRPEVADMQDERIANLAAPSFSADASVSEQSEANDGLLFDQASQEVVDFGKITDRQPHGDIDALPDSAVDEGWSLDMPAFSLSGDAAPAGGAAEDLRDMFQMDQVESFEESAVDLGVTETGISADAPSDDLDDDAPIMSADEADDDILATGDFSMEMEASMASQHESIESADLSAELDSEQVEAIDEPAEDASKAEAVLHELPDDPFGDESSGSLLEDDEPILDMEEAAAEDDAPILSEEEALAEPPSAFEAEDDDPLIGESEEPADEIRQPAPLGSQQGSLAGELEEIDFFISVEAFEDARNLIDEAHERFGDHPLLLERLQEVEARTQASESLPPQPLPKGDASDNAENPDAIFGDDEGDGFFDLASELNDELLDGGEVNDATSQEEIQSVEELFQEFKKGVEQQIDADDHQTHYDLGIAYKEMGLLEEAIGEFEVAQKDPSRLLECITMIGNCLVELGRTEDAISHFQGALDGNSLDAESQKAVHYEIAQGYEGLGELENALASFREIEKLDPDYRDLGARIEALV